MAEIARAERRVFPRAQIVSPILFEASLKGPHTEIISLNIRGLTINLSQGGVLAHLEKDLAVGVRGQVRFVEPNGLVRPESVTGTVSRHLQGPDDFIVAITFDEPLDRLAGVTNAKRKAWPLSWLLLSR